MIVRTILRQTAVAFHRQEVVVGVPTVVLSTLQILTRGRILGGRRRLVTRPVSYSVREHEHHWYTRFPGHACRIRSRSNLWQSGVD